MAVIILKGQKAGIMKRDNLPLEITEKSKSKISMALSIITLLLLSLILTQVDKAFVTADKKAASNKAREEQQKEAEDSQETTTSSVNILAAGNNIFDDNILLSGQADAAAWNYDQLYSLIRDQIGQADLSIVSQESVLTTDHNLTSAGPVYSTPAEAGTALVNAGFDIIASATDHVDDFGSEYMNHMLEFWRSSCPDTTVLGVHNSQEDADSIRVIEKNQIKIAFLNYTFGSSTGSAKNEQPFLVDYLEREKVTNAITQAKSISDCIIFLAHWGTLDNAVPNEYQNQWAQFLLQQGVTVLIGTHPQVLQPYHMLSDANGNEMLVYYSLGNLVSGAQSSPQLLGGLAKFTLEKTTSGETSTVKVTASALDPIVMHYSENMNICNVYPLAAYTDTLAQSHGVLALDYYSTMEVSSLQNLFNYIMNLPVTPSGGLNLLDYSFNPDTTLSGPDGSIVYPGEIEAANSSDGSLGTLLQVMSGEISVSSQNLQTE